MSDLLKSYQNQAATIIKALESRQMNGYFVKDKAAAKAQILALIKEDSTISWGGSLTLDQIGIKEALYEGSYQLLDRSKAQTKEEAKAVYRDALSADYYLTSTNAITLDGKLVNIDGNGNRVAAMVYGPDYLIVVAGMNKVVLDEKGALDRVRNIAAPPNTVRLNKNTPCAITGKCNDCKSEDCICSSVLITRFCNNKNRIHIILVGESLGF